MLGGKMNFTVNKEHPNG